MGVIEASDRAWKVVQMTNERHGTAEWLRGRSQRLRSLGEFSCKDFMAYEFGISSPCDGRRCRDCYADMFERIADRIDAERALPDGMEWPRFEDGGLVRIGDELEFEGKTMLVCDATFYADSWALWCDREDMSGRLYGKYGERVKRPAPEVHLVYAGQILRWHSANPEKLTHERPDSWRLWGEDLDMAVKFGEVDKVEMMNRAKALAKAGEGL